MVDFNFDKSFENPIVGIDEVGRGSWAGPVVAGACLLNHNIPLPKNLNDSKKLSPKIRHEIFEELKQTVSFGRNIESGILRNQMEQTENLN